MISSIHIQMVIKTPYHDQGQGFGAGGGCRKFTSNGPMVLKQIVTVLAFYKYYFNEPFTAFQGIFTNKNLPFTN